jgi:hypothetical protein
VSLEGTQADPRARSSAFVLACAGLNLALHLATANRYGIFRDEMYALDCAQHLSLGYVDCPPVGALIAWVARHLFGTSLYAVRLLPALAGAATVWATGQLAREMGGRAFAQGLAALAFCVVPIYALLDHWLTLNAFEALIWTGTAWYALRAINSDDGRYWLGFGAMAGLGLETKYTIILLIGGVVAGLALTRERRWLGSWYLWSGFLIAGLIALPNFIWQAAHGFPFLELIRNVAASHRDIVRGPWAFMVDQAVIMNLVLAPLWVGGALWLLFGPKQRLYAGLGWACLFALAIVIALKGKNYYVSSLYPILLAAGAIGFETLTEGRTSRWARIGYVGTVIVSGFVLLPLVMPILSPESFLRYEHWTGLKPIEAEHSRSGPLPQYFADEFGWEEMVQEVARIYHGLPPAEQPQAAIFANDWGDAAAVDYYGPKYGLPPAICKSVSYWLWGPRSYTGAVVIVLKTDGRGDRESFSSVEKVGHVQSPYSRREEWFDIYLCRGLKADIRQVWPKLKSYP